MSIQTGEISNIFFKSNVSFWDYITDNNIKTVNGDDSYAEFLPIEGAFYACLKFINGKEVFSSPLKIPPQLIPPISISNPRFQAGYIAVALNFVTDLKQLDDAPGTVDWREVSELRSSVLSRVIGEQFDNWAARPSEYSFCRVNLPCKKSFYKIYDNDFMSIKVVGSSWSVSFLDKRTFAVTETINVEFNADQAPVPIDPIGLSPFIGCVRGGKPGVFDMRSSEYVSLSIDVDNSSFALNNDSVISIYGNNSIYIVDIDSSDDDVKIEPISVKQSTSTNSRVYDEATGVTSGYIGTTFFSFSESSSPVPSVTPVVMSGDDILVTSRVINLSNNLSTDDTVVLSIKSQDKKSLGSPFAEELGPVGKMIAILSTVLIFIISICACGLLAAGITTSYG